MHYTFLRGVRLVKKKESKKKVISAISVFSIKLIWWSASACTHLGIRKGCSNYTVVTAGICKRLDENY